MITVSNFKRALLTVAFFITAVYYCALPVRAQGGVCLIPRELVEARWAEHAKCMLRFVGVSRQLGPAVDVLPEPLKGLIGQANIVSADVIKNYLRAKGIAEANIGGSLDSKIERARYFIIHDTSSPNLRRKEFSSEPINSPEWNSRVLSGFIRGQRTHVWVNRVGNSATSRDFALVTVKTGVKLEDRFPALRPLFLHIELIQPRRCDPTRRVCCWKDARGEERCNDTISPEPGFPVAQYDRLALLYVTASTRRGRWLVPTFHGVVDDEFGTGAHDDPQRFDLNLWATRLQALLGELGFALNAKLDEHLPNTALMVSETPKQ